MSSEAHSESKNAALRLIELHWQRDVIERWLLASLVPADSIAPLEELLSSVDRELAGIETTLYGGIHRVRVNPGQLKAIASEAPNSELDRYEGAQAVLLENRQLPEYITRRKNMAAKFDLKQGGSGQFMFNLKAGNGEVILTSELYEQKQSALAGIDSVKVNAGDDTRYQRRTAKNGQAFFVLTATNGQIIGKSEMYSSVSAMENGIQSVKKNGPVAAIEDSTKEPKSPAA